MTPSPCQMFLIGTLLHWAILTGLPFHPLTLAIVGPYEGTAMTLFGSRTVFDETVFQIEGSLRYRRAKGMTAHRSSWGDI
ncbi:hypothetical protein BU24DRAFT_27614 [Aaosphaeria arxii CBS 175.79]|uniref:Uncharacterized protein n=1 Tax=Aaosphaeria arxii CBS 175.79 TaxID=1450172 RepID=A0A6A5YAC1_9PLEO|nr:uncharacterized protein BU24DRAFT_27614 [Aaosphaeria arxii CBS 175.79]KAF2021750.1 hypothetical protein BU24DRAFT_27614 [Aaosphaeria arxii CBS 175.79]